MPRSTLLVGGADVPDASEVMRSVLLCLLEVPEVMHCVLPAFWKRWTCWTC